MRVLLVLWCGVWISHIITFATETQYLSLGGTTVSMVGNAPSLMAHEWGPTIDMANIVVRFNTFVLLPRHTGTQTHLHVTTAGSPRLFDNQTHMVVYNTAYHEWFGVFVHPYAFHLHHRGLRRILEDDDGSGPSSGLAASVFVAAIAPRLKVSTYGIGEIASRTQSVASLHYFDPGNGSLVDQVSWQLSSAFGLHHQRESALMLTAQQKFRNLNRQPTVCDRFLPGSSRHFWRELRDSGIVVERAAFARHDLEIIRTELEARSSDVGGIARFLHRFVNPTGISTVDFLRRAGWYASHHGMYRTANFADTCLREWIYHRFGSDVVIGTQSDITSDAFTRWHKDRLNNHPILGAFRARYERMSPWEGTSEYNIFKVLLYLQDGPALDIVNGSHRHPTIETDSTSTSTVVVRVGDVVVFDQRLTHRGHSNISEFERIARSFATPPQRRLLVTLSVAYKNSSHLPGFARGTNARQDAIFAFTERVSVLFWLACGWPLILVVFVTVMRRLRTSLRHHHHVLVEQECRVGR